MRKALLFSLIVTCCLIGLLYSNSSMAWFMDSSNASEANLTLGTVTITSNQLFLGNTTWRPGECTIVSWNLQNTGTKRVYLRVKPNGSWMGEGDGTDTSLDDSNVTWSVIGDDWQLGDDDWYYYCHIVYPNQSLSIEFNICLDEGDTGFEYDSAEYNFNIQAEFIQSTNNAVSNWVNFPFSNN